MRISLTATLLLAMAASAFAGDTRTGRGYEAAEPRPSAAAVALFVNSNLDSARALAATALRLNPRDPDALFVEMEAAALAADSAGELAAALRLVESGDTDDPRVTVAAARIGDAAGNTSPFRAVLPRVQRLVAAGAPHGSLLRAALITAAEEGAPGISTLQLARASGLLTEWRVAGPFGEYPNVAFDRSFAPEADGLAQAAYDGRRVEGFRFDDGNFSLAEYFSQNGVFYAASNLQVANAATYRLRVESGGTLEVFVDGASALQKDNRFRAAAEVAAAELKLTAGTHRVLVKFIPAAAPFRVTLLPIAQANRSANASASYVARTIAEPEASYVEAAERFWTGDYDGAIARLTARRQQPSAAADYLLAEAWSHAAQDSPEEPALLESALKQAPLALAAEYELAERAYNAEHLDEAFARARKVAAARPEYIPAQHLLAQAAMRLNWHAEAAQAFDTELRLRPACATLRSAAKFFSSIAAYDRAAQAEKQLAKCAPASLAYAEVLAESGRHAEAAAAAQTVVAQHPLDREARALLVRELASAGQTDSARQSAAELVALAPNAARFRRLAAQLETGGPVFDTPAPRAREFAAEKQFYTPYRRDALELVRKTANRRFSGGPAVVLLQDRVARLESDGSVALYVHKLTRVLNRDGIEKYGEVASPRNAELLELRTLKQDGTIVEPEFNQHKSTVSMPALAPGDVIEQEYVVHFAEGGLSERGDAFSYTFGSFTAPILYARFVAITPADAAVDIAGNAPAPATTPAGETTTRVWEQENILQSTDETAAPRTDTLPTVRVLARRNWQDVRDFYRNELIEASRVGARVETAARELQGDTPESTARQLYKLVTTRLRSTTSGFESGEVASGESTLANYAGSRTTALLALSAAAGLDAELLLARDVGKPRPALPVFDGYTRPLVRFRFSQKDVVVDAESDGLAFGVVPPTIAREDALVVPLTETGTRQQPAMLTALPAATGDEHSVADGDIAFDAEGTLTAKLTIRMGASRSAQMRNVLGGIEPRERKHFFESLALRIFPGVADADGVVHNEHDAERPLELLITCRAPHFLNLAGDAVDLEQLAPALGLRKMYGAGPRKLPLYIDTPLVETTTFRVHLPAGFTVTGLAGNLKVENEFGQYEANFHQPVEGEVEVRRAFRIPVQMIAPERFDNFARFERQVDDAERQRLTLGRAHALAARAAGR